MPYRAVNQFQDKTTLHMVIPHQHGRSTSLSGTLRPVHRLSTSCLPDHTSYLPIPLSVNNSNLPSPSYEEVLKQT